MNTRYRLSLVVASMLLGLLAIFLLVKPTAPLNLIKSATVSGTQAKTISPQSEPSSGETEAGNPSGTSPSAVFPQSRYIASQADDIRNGAGLFAAHALAAPSVSKSPVAQVKVGGQVYLQKPNQIGGFPRIEIEPKAKVSVQVNYPAAAPGDAVVVQVEDGGRLQVNGKSAMSTVASVDAQNNIQFAFQATQQLGIYRIALRNGANVQVVNLWAENQ